MEQGLLIGENTCYAANTGSRVVALEVLHPLHLPQVKGHWSVISEEY